MENMSDFPKLQIASIRGIWSAAFELLVNILAGQADIKNPVTGRADE